MKYELFKNWLLGAVVFVCIIVALILLMAEPNQQYDGLTEVGILVATKLGAIACGFIAYTATEILTHRIKK